MQTTTILYILQAQEVRLKEKIRNAENKNTWNIGNKVGVQVRHILVRGIFKILWTAQTLKKTAVVTRNPLQGLKARIRALIPHYRTQNTNNASIKENNSIEIEHHVPETTLATNQDRQSQTCPHHFGFLNQHSREGEIPDECLTCGKAIDCVYQQT